MSSNSYTVRKTPFARSPWTLLVDHDGNHFPIGHYGTKRAAILAARLLAGWRGKVTVEVPLKGAAWDAAFAPKGA